MGCGAMLIPYLIISIIAYIGHEFLGFNFAIICVLALLIIGLFIEHAPPIETKIIQWREHGVDADFLKFLETCSAEDIEYVFLQGVRITDDELYKSFAIDHASKNPDKKVLDIIRREAHPKVYGENLWHEYTHRNDNDDDF